MQPTLLEQGLTLMLVGMGTVFVFLTALVAAMSAMAWTVRRLAPEPASDGVTEAEVAAITAAVAEHRKQQR